MKKKVFVFLIVFFSIMFGTGIAWMNYEMFNTSISLILTLIGLIGLVIVGEKYIKS